MPVMCKVHSSEWRFRHSSKFNVHRRWKFPDYIIFNTFYQPTIILGVTRRRCHVSERSYLFQYVFYRETMSFVGKDTPAVIAYVAKSLKKPRLPV